MKVLMIGPGRGVKGGISSLVNEYYKAGLDKRVSLKFIATMVDGNKFIKLIIAVSAYIRFCISIRDCDIVHVHMSQRASFLRKSLFISKAYRAKKKIIIHMHGSQFDKYYYDECDDRQKSKIRDVFSKASYVIALSEGSRRMLSDFCDSDKIVVLPNAVTMPDYVKNDYSDKNVLFLGGYEKRKGIDDLLEAIPKVLDKLPDAQFIICGAGDSSKVKPQKVQEEGNIAENKSLLRNGIYDNNITWLGWVDDNKKKELFMSCRVFTLPSYDEGMPMALLEAMSYGLIAVASDAGAIADVIEAGVNGYINKPGDHDAYANNLIGALQNANAKEIGQKAYETIRYNFNMDDNIEALVRIYSLSNEAERL